MAAETPTPTPKALAAFVAALGATLVELDKRDPGERSASFVLGKLNQIVTHGLVRERTELGLSDDDLEALAWLHATLLAHVKRQRFVRMAVADETKQ